MNATRVVIADDHTLVRAGIRSLLDKLFGIEVVGEASDGREVLHLVAELQPQVVLMDIAMPNLNGLDATRQLTELHPNVRVVVLSIFSDEEYVYQALRAGASGYLLKGASIEELELAIRSVARGETFLSPQVSTTSAAIDRRRQDHKASGSGTRHLPKNGRDASRPANGSPQYPRRGRPGPLCDQAVPGRYWLSVKCECSQIPAGF